MNRLHEKRQASVIAALIEGNSIRATVRMTGIAKNTVVKLLAEIGAACERYQQQTLVQTDPLPIKRRREWSAVIDTRVTSGHIVRHKVVSSGRRKWSVDHKGGSEGRGHDHAQ